MANQISVMCKLSICTRTGTVCDTDAVSLVSNEALHAGAAWVAGARPSDRCGSSAGAFLNWTTCLVVFAFWTCGYCIGGWQSTVEHALHEN